MNRLALTLGHLLVVITASLAWSGTAEEYLRNGDEFASAFNFQQALEQYLQAHKADSTNCTALWKIAETYINLGEEAPKETEVQYYYVAEKWARKALQQCPNEANAHFFVLVSSGKLALHEGGKEKIERSREIKEEAEKTLELDPNHHGAYHALARWHRELANLNWFLKTAAKIIYGGVPPGASMEKAVEYFKKAIEIKPDWINHHRQLGITYMMLGEWEKARAEFETVLELPIQDHEDAKHKKECRKLLEELKDKI